MKRLMLLMTVVLLALAFAAAASALTIEDQGLDLGSGSVHYPRVTSLDDPSFEDSVNQALLAAGQTARWLDRLSLVFSSPAGLTAGYAIDHKLLDADVLSCVFTARGALEDTRSTEFASAVSIDLTDGHVISWDDLFAEPETAQDAIEEILEYTVMPELSAHLLNSELLPLPEGFALDEAGMTLYYPIGQLQTLSDRAGSVQIAWFELLPYLKLGDGTILDRIGAEAHLRLSSREAMARALINNSLPGVPAKLGDSVKLLTDEWRMLTDPDLYASGRIFALEGAPFRNVMILTDDLTDTWDASLVQGVRSDRIALCGLITGVTFIDEWRGALGDPDATVSLDEESAEALRLPAGTSDYYAFEACRLRLHADQTGKLCSVWLIQ